MVETSVAIHTTVLTEHSDAVLQICFLYPSLSITERQGGTEFYICEQTKFGTT